MLTRKNNPHKIRRSSLHKNKKPITMITRKNFRNKKTNLKLRKTNQKLRKTNQKLRKTKQKLKKTKHNMKGGDKTLSNILKINFDPPENNLINLETDLFNIKYSPINNYMRTPGLNVGQPNNAPYTGFCWYQ